jgi:ferric-dicitrate binding protein FerR (iron transport regulator)
MPGNQREDIAYYQQLIRKLMDGSIEESERRQLEDWYNKGLEDPVHIPAEFATGEEEQEKRLLEQIRDKAGLQAAPRMVARRMRTWWAAAAALIVVAGAASLLYLGRSSEGIKGGQQAAAIKDVKAPQRNRATITLADGTQLVLDSMANGTLAAQANAQLVKLGGGQVAYQNTRDGGGAEPVYNTLTNPRGSQVVTITLADGSRVWLNAGSSVTYPVAFTGKKRAVELKGEGYFEVAKKAGQQFVVTARGIETAVLGTHFNINAYEEETDTKITLLEGAVQVQTGASPQGAHTLRPGEQASFTTTGKLTTTRPDLDQVMAWKKGDFYFSGADIETVMRQAARWYDLEVEYRGKVTGTLSGDVSRSVNASELFQVLALTGRVSFEMQGRKVIVIPK